MKKTWRKILAAAVALAVVAGLGVAGWRMHQLHPRDIPVLMYHNVLDGDGLSVWQVTAEEFAWQMDQLREAGYTTILPEDIARAAKGWGWMPRKPVVVTFDDGYEGVKTFAEPILAERGMKGICYVIVGRIAGEGEERASFDSGPLMSTNEVAAMGARGVVAIGSHSMSHARGNPRQLGSEIRPSRRELRRLTGIKTRSYCYPYGLHGYDYMYDALYQGHYTTALACGDEMFHYGTDTNLMAIPRLSVYGGRHAIKLKSMDAAGGMVVLENKGAKIPLRVVVKDEASGREWNSDLQWVEGDSVPFRFPAEALTGARRIEAWDKAGLFRYLGVEHAP
jgi:peptidoglycan/xylan/chitin deacetylase (PgdA/CDA1 family)